MPLVDVPLVEFTYLVLTCMPGERYHRQLRFLLYLRYAFQALINSTVCLSILLGNGREIFEFSTWYVTAATPGKASLLWQDVKQAASSACPTNWRLKPTCEKWLKTFLQRCWKIFGQSAGSLSKTSKQKHAQQNQNERREEQHAQQNNQTEQ